MKAISIFLSVVGIAAAGAWYGYYEANRSWELRWANYESAQAEREAKWQDRIEQVQYDAEKQLDEIRQRERIAADSRVRNAANAYARTHTCPEPSSATAPATVLAELLGDADELAERFAREADNARARGAACEQQYDALTLSVSGATPAAVSSDGPASSPSR